MKVEIGDSLSEGDVIWQYMPIEKFICLFSDRSIYLPSLSVFENSDPFEGYIPTSAIHALYGIVKNSPQSNRRIDLPNIHADFKRHISGIFVNCWHCNKFESEAMWKLYSKLNEGIAIKTSIGRLKQCVEQFGAGLARIGRVKYLDFKKLELDPMECLSDGVLMPLIKRESFSHEKEIRLYQNSWEGGKQVIPDNMKFQIIKIDPLQIFDEIYISPYSSEIFAKSVGALCEMFRVEKRQIIRSQLLGNPSDLFVFN